MVMGRCLDVPCRERISEPQPGIRLDATLLSQGAGSYRVPPWYAGTRAKVEASATLEQEESMRQPWHEAIRLLETAEVIASPTPSA